MKKAIILLAGISALSAASLAGITYDGMGGHQTVKVTFHGSNHNYSNDNVTAGKLKFQDPTNGCGLGTTFYSLCVDLDRNVGSSAFNVSCTDTFGAGGGLEMAGKICRAFFAAAGTSNSKCAALQVAIWEALYDGVANGGATPDFSHGAFKCSTSSVLAQATIYYSAATNPTGNSRYLRPTGSKGQAQIAPVPEPATVGVLVAGAIGLIRRRSRKNQK
ncbi:MAG: PEP-CTERM sorting domain-containing protein [Armatimonadetes bacterium]|nr:PEP-CTERM sorting domain-containing protein [Armatimonadota bacterium]